MSDFVDRATRAVAGRVSPGGRRYCHMCSLLIRPGQPAVRVATILDVSNPIGRLKYWLCRHCADQVDEAIDKATA